MKVEVLEIKKVSKEGASLFTGIGDSYTGHEVRVKFLEDYEGFFYFQENQVIPKEGKEEVLFFKGENALDALLKVQLDAETVNYTDVEADFTDEFNPVYTGGERIVKDDTNGILNLTQHPATPDQVAAGVIEPLEKEQVQNLLTFDVIPNRDDMDLRASLLSAIAAGHGCDAAMIGGAPFFMSALARALIDAGITPVYAFSVRESVEKTDADGNVVKTNVFKHVGFVEVTE